MGHGTDGEIFVEFVHGGGGTGAARRDYGGAYFHRLVEDTRGAEEEAVHEAAYLSRCRGIIDRCADHDGVGPGEFGRHFVNYVVEDAAAVCAAEATGHATAYFLVPCFDALKFHSFGCEGLLEFRRRTCRAAVRIRASVDGKYFHV